MKNILITGATGNVEIAVINSLVQNDNTIPIYAGVRNIEKSKVHFNSLPVHLIRFDFEDPTTYEPALKNCGTLFLLRPPQIANVKKYFEPLIKTAQIHNVGHIVFLSVQGVETNSFIPHNKIEKLIVNSGINYTFLCPAYFMQNFNDSLNKDLTQKHRIFLPAGRARFTLIDVTDIGKVAAKILATPEQFINQRFELTNHEKLNFEEMAEQLSNVLGHMIAYQSPSLIRFFIQKRKEKVAVSFIFIMIMLHYLPRFQKEPQTTNWVENITGQLPKTFTQYIADNKLHLL